MFSINVLRPAGESLVGGRHGEIVIGDFRERFICHPAGEAEGLEAGWRAELSALAEGAPVALLRYDLRFAWIVYREGDMCYVQQRLSLDGTFSEILPRVTMTEDGDVVSTWITSVAAIRQFRDAASGTGPDAARLRDSGC